MNTLKSWSNIALINLAIVATLGLLMRSKFIFSLPAVNFKHTLHAHSHFAFGGWVTLALLALMTYQLLPATMSKKPIYKFLLSGILLNAIGMLVSFSCQGYGLFSITFSTLFIFVSYAFSIVFIKDMSKTRLPATIKILAVSSLVYLVLSSVGPFTLAYLMATRSPNLILYKDSIYTYLHLQYSGFFTLSIFALLIHKLVIDNRTIRVFSALLNFSVIPSMFISYLWHYPGAGTYAIAIAGSLSLLACTFIFLKIIFVLREKFLTLRPTTRILVTIAMTAFVLKMLFQSLTIIPSLGELVFNNRPVIIGFLHLVLLAFISLYILGHFIEDELIELTIVAKIGLWLFVSGVVLNEIILLTQGLGFMLMLSSAITQWLLWIAAICLMSGALMLSFNNIRHIRIMFPEHRKTERSFLTIIKKV